MISHIYLLVGCTTLHAVGLLRIWQLVILGSDEALVHLIFYSASLVTKSKLAYHQGFNGPRTWVCPAHSKMIKHCNMVVQYSAILWLISGFSQDTSLLYKWKINNTYRMIICFVIPWIINNVRFHNFMCSSSYSMKHAQV